jgi:hypothetical protein
MTNDMVLMGQLADKLAPQPKLRNLDSPDISEASRLAHALIDLKGSFEKYLGELLPKLIESKDEDTIDRLQEIGDELRHISYHLHDPKFFEVYVGTVSGA